VSVQFHYRCSNRYYTRALLSLSKEEKLRCPGVVFWELELPHFQYPPPHPGRKTSARKPKEEEKKGRTGGKKTKMVRQLHELNGREKM
jgi:hypothetical protein